jgi:NAD(P)-dependent dehydrogenase (short-subunit alcohol dehydrogenase family)
MTVRPGPVLITGANSGIGLATTLLLAQRGWSAWGTVRSKAKATALRRAAVDAGVEASVTPLVLDVSDDAAVIARWPDLPAFYAVVNNAGYSELGAVEEVSAKEARAQLDVNVVAPAIVSACALPAMRAQGAGRIVMVSSIAGRAAILPLNGWYHASKFALEALSDVLRMEVAGFGVKVSIVEPGFFKTGIGTSARDRADTRGAADDSPYATAYRRSTTGLDAIERLAPPPDVVARVIASAIESRRPLRRYLVGIDALSVAATQPLIPRALTDAATRFVTGLGGASRDDR